ncbi:aspartate/glutamate racemase family protein [Terribacillus sp. DMT04]|uniref:aspartate/glutamate racemase family protein n=1 Tax=Terribacillus sp. DMT04 TaxID=2850441 RepID=UPI001C2B9AF8|nr:aspartate/glutamate racemase family protein [Terribacillus sp. DMT04]QXE02550.1 aspartate/glutamate racemase family protein [Terribacillus sp. DMT04]
MKNIGLIGGMSWESTTEYYRIINEEVKKELGGLHSAKCVMYSVDFHEIETYQAEGDWQKAGELLGEAASSLEKAGASFIVICTNTMHKVTASIEENINIPILHIADATAKQIREANIKKVGLLGTSYTMEQDFYRERIASNSIEVIVPDKTARQEVNRVIYEELCLGIISEPSRQYYKSVIEDLEKQGAEGIILGCTEIGLLLQQTDSQVPLFDTTTIHALEAVRASLDE